MLNEQNIDIVFGEGQDTKPRNQIAVKPTRLENVVFSGRALTARPGATTITQTDDSGATISDCGGLATFKSTMLRASKLASGGVHKLKSYAAAQNYWAENQDLAPFATVDRTPVVRGSRSQSRVDAATDANITVVVWRETSGPQPGIHASVVDNATGAYYQRDTLLDSASAVYPRVVYVGTTFIAFWVDGANLKSKVLASPTSWGATNTLRTDATAQWFDAISPPFSGYAVVGYTTGANIFTLAQVSSTGLLTGGHPISATDTGAALGTSFSLCADGSFNVYVALASQSRVLIFDSTFGPLASVPITATGAMSTQCLRTDGTVAVFCDGFNGVVTWSVVNTSAETSTGTLGRNIAIITGAYQAPGNGPVLIGVIYANTVANVQPSCWVLTQTGTVVARILPGASITNPGSGEARVPAPIYIGSTLSVAFFFPESGHIAYSVDSGGLTHTITPRGTSMFSVALKQLADLPRVEIGDLLFVGGANPAFYDGVTWSEAGFSLFPEGLSDQGAAVGGLTNPGNYSWRAVYSWVDGQGAVHRSAPSPALTVTVNSTARIIRVPTLSLTSKSAAVTNKVMLELYRTQNNGTLYYLATSVTSPTLNDPTVSYIDITDGLSDAQLIVNEALYTEGGALEGIAPPACKLAIAHRDRIFIAGLEDPYAIRYSTKSVKGYAPRFNEALELRVPATLGKVMALGSLDGRLLIACERGVYVVSGDGPNEAGQQNTFTEPEVITESMGATDWHASITTPAGWVFQSSEGLRLIGRDFQLSPTWGLEMDSYAGYTFVSAQRLTNLPQVRWQANPSGNDQSANAVALVWDFEQPGGQWSVFTNPTNGYGAIDAVVYGGRYHRAISNGVIAKDSPSFFQDYGSVDYTQVVELPWVKLSGLQGFQRVWRALLLGLVTSDGAITWDVGYDYDTSYNALDQLAVNTSALGLSATAPMQLRRQFRRQKCETIRFRIQVVRTGATSGCVSLTGVTLVAGVRKGGFKGLSSSQSF